MRAPQLSGIGDYSIPIARALDDEHHTTANDILDHVDGMSYGGDQRAVQCLAAALAADRTAPARVAHGGGAV